MTLRVGDRAPDFTLPASGGGPPVTLSKLLGMRAVVVFFYPKDETPGCTIEACAFRDHYEAFVEAGAEVVGISTDSVASHDHFAGRYRLPMKLLSDEAGEVRARWGVQAALGILAGRTTFVLDRDGTVRHVFASRLRFEKHVEEALRVVRALSSTR